MDALVYRMADGGYGATVHMADTNEFVSVWAPTLVDLGDSLLDYPGDMQVYTEDAALLARLHEVISSERIHNGRPEWAIGWELGTYPYPGNDR